MSSSNEGRIVRLQLKFVIRRNKMQSKKANQMSFRCRLSPCAPHHVCFGVSWTDEFYICERQAHSPSPHGLWQVTINNCCHYIGWSRGMSVAQSSLGEWNEWKRQPSQWPVVQHLLFKMQINYIFILNANNRKSIQLTAFVSDLIMAKLAIWYSNYVSVIGHRPLKATPSTHSTGALAHT